jgi:hypothetical protein
MESGTPSNFHVHTGTVPTVEFDPFSMLAAKTDKEKLKSKPIEASANKATAKLRLQTASITVEDSFELAIENYSLCYRPRKTHGMHFLCE